MAEQQNVEMLAIDVLDVEFPQVLPVKRKEVKELLHGHKRCLRLLETWARIHLAALTAHPLTPTRFADYLIDEIGGKAIGETRDKVFQEFSRAHVQGIETPIGFRMADEDLAVGDYANTDDEMRLVEPDHKRRRGSFFRRLLKWKPKRKTKDEKEEEEPMEEPYSKEIEDDRLRSYEALKVRFDQFIDQEVCRHRDIRNSRRASMGERVTDPGTEEGRWIAEMTHRLHVCHMAVKIMGIVREKCKDVFKILTFSDPGPDGCFQGEYSKLMQSRMAYLRTTNVVVLIMVRDIEKMQMDNEIYADCVKNFRRVRGGEKQVLSRMDSAEQKVMKCMRTGESITDKITPTHERRAENMLKSESQQNLLLAAEEPYNVISDYTIFCNKGNTSGSSADLAFPNIQANIPIITPKGGPGQVLQVSLSNGTDQVLYRAPEPAANSTSGYSSASVSLLSQTPADPLQDSSPREGMPSFLDLPDPSTHRSKEGSTSPMQTSPPEKIPVDEAAADILKEDGCKKLEATKGKGSTSPMQTAPPEEIPSVEDSTDDSDEYSTDSTEDEDSAHNLEDKESTDNLEGDKESTDNLEEDSDKKLKGTKCKRKRSKGKGKRSKGKRKGSKSKESTSAMQTAPPEKPVEEDSADKLKDDIEKKLKDL